MNPKCLAVKLKPALLAAALACILTGCAATTGPERTLSTQEAFSPLTLTLEGYQDLVSQVNADGEFNALILLTRAQTVTGDTQSAKATITALRQSAITPLQNDEIAIIEALVLSQEGDNLSAAANLNAVNEMTLPPQAASYFYQLSTRVNENLFKDSGSEQYLERAFASQKALLNVIDDSQRAAVLNRTVALLQNYPASTLAARESSAASDEDRGYYAYALIAGSTNPDLKARLLKGFEEKYPNHPLSLLAESQAQQPSAVPGDTQALGTVPYLKDGDRLAVLLPLSGRFAAAAGEPARLGLLAALQDLKPAIKVVFYDTAKIPMSEIVTDLKSTNTDFIIGPLLKPNVDALIDADAGIPAIMLNSTEKSLKTNMWYFDLSPEYEGRLAASKMTADGVRQPALVTSQGSRASRAAKAFSDSIASALGRAPYTCTFSSLDDLNAKVSQCALSQADGIYISATALEASNVKALLPSTQAVYITNQSNTGVNASSLEVSMYGANLGDMPWLITESKLKSAMMENLPKADAQVQRIFASSYDALGFALNLNRLASSAAHDVLHGLSGDISVARGGLIEAAPLWVKLGTTVRE